MLLKRTWILAALPLVSIQGTRGDEIERFSLLERHAFSETLLHVEISQARKELDDLTRELRQTSDLLDQGKALW
jgi:hypothetical protein